MAQGGRKMPTYAAQLATPVDAAPSGPEWLHEIKLDGDRVGCLVRGAEVRLVSRTGLDWTARFPEIVEAAAKVPAQTALIDGKVAVALPDGRTSAQPLQRPAPDERREGITYFAFDLLYLNGRDLRQLPLEARKRELRRLVADTPVKYCEHLDVDGPAVFEHACRLGVQGIVSKRRHRPYRASRNQDWLETNCAHQEPRGRRRTMPTARVARPRSARPARTTRVAGVPISTPERMLYPALGVTKLDLAGLYAEIAEWMLPHVAQRPLTLVRCEHGASRPDALRTQCQFLKHTADWHLWVPSSVRRVQIREQKKVGEYLAIDSPQALVAIINGDILELHAWNSTVGQLEQPDRLVFDLDPAPDLPWARVVDAALVVRAELETVGLESWVKSTGGKGLHVVVPLEPAAEWNQCFAFSRSIAESVARESRHGLTASFGKADRRGKVLIDYKRNHRTAVSVVTFSTRARPDGAMSVPLRWDDLHPDRPLEPYTVTNVRKRLATWREDPWCRFWQCRQRLQPR